jgi:hypothetical protein
MMPARRSEIFSRRDHDEKKLLQHFYSNISPPSKKKRQNLKQTKRLFTRQQANHASAEKAPHKEIPIGSASTGPALRTESCTSTGEQTLYSA